MHRTSAFFHTTIGQKVVMAVTGVILYTYIVGHVAGNLLIYAGRLSINRYAEFLHARPSALWAVRAILIAAVVLHIAVAVRLWWLNRVVVRPVPYVKKKDVPPAYVSKSMMRSGLVILAFVIFHLLHLTSGSLPLPFHRLDVYANLAQGFRIVWVAVVYIVAMVFLAMHIYHGFWSMFQSVGITHPRYTPVIKATAHVLAVLITVGFASIPFTILTRMIGS